MAAQNTAPHAQDDIAYIRALAQEGRHAPPLNGPFLVAAAVIFGGASVAQWAIQSGLINVSPWAQLWVWLAAGAAFAVALAFLIRNVKSKPGASTVRNEAIGVAWSGVGYLIFTVWLSMMAVGFSTGDWTPMRLMPSLVFAAYGTAWVVAAAMSGLKWMNLVALVSFGGAVLFGALSHTVWVYLVFAGMLMAVALIPGLILMRQEPAEVV